VRPDTTENLTSTLVNTCASLSDEDTKQTRSSVGIHHRGKESPILKIQNISGDPASKSCEHLEYVLVGSPTMYSISDFSCHIFNVSDSQHKRRIVFMEGKNRFIIFPYSREVPQARHPKQTIQLYPFKHPKHPRPLHTRTPHLALIHIPDVRLPLHKTLPTPSIHPSIHPSHLTGTLHRVKDIYTSGNSLVGTHIFSTGKQTRCAAKNRNEGTRKENGVVMLTAIGSENHDFPGFVMAR